MKLSNVAEALKALIKAGRPGFLWGPPGVGKSDIVRQIAADLKRTLIDVRAVLLDPVDLRGIPTVTEDGTTRWAPPSFLPSGKGKFILFLDELNAAPQLVQAACYQLVLDRKLGEYELPKDAIVIAAGNRETDRAITSRMSSALASRFVHINVDVDLEDWVKWALNRGIQTELIAFLRYRPNLLHAFDPQKNEKAFPCPRTWEFVSDVFAVAGDEIEYELVSGIVGEGAAAELIGFLKIFRSLPDPDLIIMSPEKVSVPDDPATKYAICGALAQKASDQNFDNIVKYANRLDPEFSVLLVRDAIERDDSLVNTQAFIKWSTDHSDVLI
jgi:hypothetical protein